MKTLKDKSFPYSNVVELHSGWMFLGRHILSEGERYVLLSDAEDEIKKLKKKINDWEHWYAERIEEIFNLYKEIKSLKTENSDDEYEPYYGWCNVEGCNNEGSNGGGCWPETGYWIVCHKHSAYYRAGKPQPKMKQGAIDREKTRGKDGILPNRKN